MNIEEIVCHICNGVAELPDRNSPEGQPEMMLVTHEELEMLIRQAIEEQS